MERSAESEVLKGIIAEAMKDLSPRQAQILNYRFGINGENPLSLKQTAQEMGVTKERIRQIEVKALEKIRQYPKVKKVIYEMSH